MYEEADIPLLGPKESQRKYRHSDKGKKTTRDYRHDNSKWIPDKKYLSRPFICWDGEGVTIDGEHRYVLLANSLGESYTDPNGIPFGDIAEWLLAVKQTNPDAINTGFALGYDFNCWLSDLSRRDVEGISTRRSYRTRGYKVAWRQGKSFYLSQSDSSLSTTVYDVFPFFQRSFVAACDEYLGTEWEGRTEIIADKKRRSTFTLDELPRIKEYNALELINLVRLCEELRSRLNKVTLRPARWDGPGAVATALMRREAVRDAMTDSPERVATAARYAYAGGRFELVQWGVIGEQ
jgi:hypothetical protein